MKKVNLLSIPVSTGTYTEFIENIVELANVKRNGYTCVANVHMLIEAYKNKSFANIVRNANIITPDGKPLAWALRMLYGIKQERVAGMDLLPDLLSAASAKSLSVYFYGGTEDVLKGTGQYVKRNYQNLKIAGTFSPPFRTLSPEEEDFVVEKINSSGANLVFVVLGCPKQEKWMASVYSKINAVLVGVGGAVPVMIGMQKRAPKWMQNIGLEWVFRLVQEPKRLFKRYAVTNSLFLYLLLKEYFRQKVLKTAL
jgi:N-acetylglucosaminyldiphosphoundecaprenol N-acetyl-beta-D-mannosaminyltransferase